MNKKFVFKYRFVTILLIVLFLNGCFAIWPALIDVLYYRGIFQVIRVVYDYTLGWLPFGSVYIVFGLLIFVIYIWLGAVGDWIKSRTWLEFKKVGMQFINFIAIALSLFYILWGFNYQQPRLADRLNFDSNPVAYDDFLDEVMLVDSLLGDLRETFVGDSTVDIYNVYARMDTETLLRKSQTEILSSWSMPNAGRVRVRKLMPKGILLRLSTAGVYIPFALEGHIDKGLHPIQWPFTMAHEMGHGYGLTDEGECNFLAFITCLNSENDLIKYSGYLAYYRYLLSNLRRADRELYISMVQSLDKNVRSDIIAINEALDKYPDFIPEFRDVVYDAYLKSHGIKEGLMSYSTIIRLVHKWKASNMNRDVYKRSIWVRELLTH